MVLEADHGWLPFWIKRLDEHAHSIAAALPPRRDRSVRSGGAAGIAVYCVTLQICRPYNSV